MNGKLLLAVIGLLTAVVTNVDRIPLLVKSLRPGTPTPTQDWIHFYVTSGNDLVNQLNLPSISPSAANLAIFTSGTIGDGSANIHVWYRGGPTGTKYVYHDDLKYHESYMDKEERHPKGNFFFNDLKIVPIGFGKSGGQETFVFLEVVPSR